MDQLNELRLAVRNRLLLSIGVCVGLGIGAFLLFMSMGDRFVSLALLPVALPIFLVPGLLLSFWVTKKPRQRYRDAFKQCFVKRSLGSVFTELRYEPEQGIPYEIIAATKMMSMGDRFHSEDHICARYNDVRFEQSDVHIEEQQQTTDSNGHTSTHYVTIFRGRWMIFDFNKEFRAKVQIAQKGFRAAKRRRFFGKKETLFQKIELESEVFNRQFQVFAQNEHDAFYILTPTFMERIQDLAAHNRGKLMFCFAGKQLHIAIHNNKDSFEPGSVFKPIDEGQVMQKIRDEIGLITQFIDGLSLDNDLFKREDGI